MKGADLGLVLKRKMIDKTGFAGNFDVSLRGRLTECLQETPQSLPLTMAALRFSRQYKNNLG